MTAGYQAELFHRLKNLAYKIETGTSGAPEIKGYSVAYGNRTKRSISATLSRVRDGMPPEQSNQARGPVTYAKAHAFEHEAVADEEDLYLRRLSIGNQTG